MARQSVTFTVLPSSEFAAVYTVSQTIRSIRVNADT